MVEIKLKPMACTKPLSDDISLAVIDFLSNIDEERFNELCLLKTYEDFINYICKKIDLDTTTRNKRKVRYSLDMIRLQQRRVEARRRFIDGDRQGNHFEN